MIEVRRIINLLILSSTTPRTSERTRTITRRALTLACLAPKKRTRNTPRVACTGRGGSLNSFIGLLEKISSRNTH